MVRRGLWGLMSILGAGVALYAYGVFFMPNLRSPVAEDLLSAKMLRGVGHLAAGGLAIVCGALQFSTRVRATTPQVHRVLGRIYVAAVVTSGLSALLLAPFSAGGVPAHTGFGLLGLLWVTSAVIAWRSAVAGEFGVHRAWMIRSYALCLAAVTLRIQLPIADVAGYPFEVSYPAIAWLCWVPNLLIAEWLVIPSRVAPVNIRSSVEKVSIAV